MSDWEHKHQKHLSANREMARTQKWEYVIFPDNKWIKKWDKFILVQLIYLLFGIPYHVGITGGYHSYEGVTAKIFWLLVYLVIDLSFIVDTLLYFFRSFRNRNGQLRFDLKKIRRRYLRTYFILNVIALTPSFQTYYYVLGGHHPDKTSMDTKLLLSVLTVLKLARFARVRNLFQASDVMTDIRRTFRSFNVSLVFYLIFLLAVSHYIACIWSFIAFCEAGLSFNEDEMKKYPNWMGSWYDDNNLEDYNSFYEKNFFNPLGWDNTMDRYFLSLFWSIQSITSIGYGNISPITRVEFKVGCFLMILAGFAWSYFIAGLVGLVSEMNNGSIEFGRRNDLAQDLVRNFKPDEDDEPIESELQTEIASDSIRDFSSKGVVRVSKYECTVSDKDLSNRIFSYLLDQRQKSSQFALSHTTLESKFPIMRYLSPTLKNHSSLLLLKNDLNCVKYLSDKILKPLEQSYITRECTFLEFAQGDIYTTANVASHERGILIIKSGTALATCRGRNRQKTTQILTVGTSVLHDIVLFGDKNYNAFNKGSASGHGLRIDFLNFSKVLFIPIHAIETALAVSEPARKYSRWILIRKLIATGMFFNDEREAIGLESPRQNKSSSLS
eukprot:CAMPEP_0178939932 /NCGR_PEP_ID=MMETSP0789-20121207/502_1 /TAXON_ID=3005 /ORGANISM="Rhizosolenia setigera, Strain CCMP 1694" /LENGTH=610 /DNA_ID=CAMNT_0020618863 /DNA_START=88 /DNA_END=1920 /DNA_ORIENTATION=-